MNFGVTIFLNYKWTNEVTGAEINSRETKCSMWKDFWKIPGDFLHSKVIFQKKENA